MIILIANRIASDGTWDCSFQTANPQSESQKATAFIGHPGDRRAPVARRRWKVTLPESASFQDDAVIWFDEGRFRTLTANEVFEFAQKQMHGFSCVDA